MRLPLQEFLAEFKASKAEYADYQSAVAEWEKLTGNKAESDSMKARLQRKQQEVKERENNRQSHQHKKTELADKDCCRGDKTAL